MSGRTVAEAMAASTQSISRSNVMLAEHIRTAGPPSSEAATGESASAPASAVYEASDMGGTRRASAKRRAARLLVSTAAGAIPAGLGSEREGRRRSSGKSSAWV
eukprot:scaffold109231_cov28-Tisochrysis_lutea.AAC.4